MKFLFLSFMVAGVVFLIAFGNSNPSLRRAFRVVLLGTALVFLAITAACLIFPFFSRAEGRFLPMLLAFFPGCIGLVAWSLWRSAADAESYNRLSPHEQQARTKEDFRTGRIRIEDSLARKKAKRTFFMTPSARARLRQQIRADEALLQGLDVMEDAYDQDQANRQAGLSPTSVRERLASLLRPGPPNPRR